MKRKPKGRALFREIFQMCMVVHALRQAWSTHNGFQDTQGYIVRTYFLKKAIKKEKRNYLLYEEKKVFFLKEKGWVLYTILYLTGISGSMLLAGYLELSNNFINRNNTKLKKLAQEEQYYIGYVFINLTRACVIWESICFILVYRWQCGAFSWWLMWKF